MSSCEVCGADGASLHVFDVRWPDGTQSPPVVWSGSLCDTCIPAYINQMRDRLIVVERSKAKPGEVRTWLKPK